MDGHIEYVLEHQLATISLATILLVFFGVLLRSTISGRSIDLVSLLQKAIAAGGLPGGLALLYCAFVPSLLPKLEGISLYSVIAGLSVLTISFVGMGIIRTGIAPDQSSLGTSKTAEPAKPPQAGAHDST